MLFFNFASCESLTLGVIFELHFFAAACLLPPTCKYSDGLGNLKFMSFIVFLHFSIFPFLSFKRNTPKIDTLSSRIYTRREKINALHDFATHIPAIVDAPLFSRLYTSSINIFFTHILLTTV